MKKLLAMLTALTLTLTLTACGGGKDDAPAADPNAVVYKVGICNYVDDASLNQIVENIQTRLEELGQEQGVTFDVSYDICNGDANVLNQIIANFIADDVDLMIGVATPGGHGHAGRHRGKSDPRGVLRRVRSGEHRRGGEPGGPRSQHHRHQRLSGHQRRDGADAGGGPGAQDGGTAL